MRENEWMNDWLPNNIEASYCSIRDNPNTTENMLNVDIISATFAVCYFVECFVPLSHSQTKFLFGTGSRNMNGIVCVCACVLVLWNNIYPYTNWLCVFIGSMCRDYDLTIVLRKFSDSVSLLVWYVYVYLLACVLFSLIFIYLLLFTFSPLPVF